MCLFEHRYFSEWPDKLKWLGNMFSAMNLDFVSLAQPSCYGFRMNFYHRFATMVVTTLGLIVFPWIFSMIRARC